MEPDAVWTLFLQALWRYQFTQHVSPLTPELSQALYDETQGITDLAVKVYMLAQIRAMTTGREQVTTGLIHSVAADSLRLAQPMLRALRSRDRAQLAQFEDIQPLEMPAFLPAEPRIAQPAVETAKRTESPASAATAASPSPKVHEGLLALAATGYETLHQAGFTRSLRDYLEEVSS